MAHGDVLGEIIAVAACLRVTLEGTIGEWRRRSGRPAPEGHAPTFGMCRGASYGALLVFRERVPQVSWRLAGGWGREAVSMVMPDGTSRPDVEGRIDTALWPGGMVDADGRWEGHFWIEGTIGDGGSRVIVDLTADQFGYGPFVVTGADDPRYRANVLPGAVEAEFTRAEQAWGWNLLADHALSSGLDGPQGSWVSPGSYS